MSINLTALLISSELVANAFTARVHARIACKDFSRLWYTCRSLDPIGRGVVEVPIQLISSILNQSVSTIYRQLRHGKESKAFRSYRIRKGNLVAYLGSLTSVCAHRKIENWGATAVVKLPGIIEQFRPTVTGFVAQSLQQASSYVARFTKESKARRALFSHSVNDLVAKPKTFSASERRIKNFQKTIAASAISASNSSQVPLLERELTSFQSTNTPYPEYLSPQSNSSQVPLEQRELTSFQSTNILPEYLSPQLPEYLSPQSNSSQVPLEQRELTSFQSTNILPECFSPQSNSSQVPLEQRELTSFQSTNTPYPHPLECFSLQSNSEQVPLQERELTSFQSTNTPYPLGGTPEVRSVINTLVTDKLILKQEREMQSSPKTAVGQVPFVLHDSGKRLFVSRNFLCFGASQLSISREKGQSIRTVQRHLDALGIPKRQLCQEKAEYKTVRIALREDFSSFEVFEQGQNTHVSYKDCGDHVYFQDGISLWSKTTVPNSYSIPKEQFKNRFFKQGTQTFMSKCNLYRETYELTTMRYAKKLWKQRYQKEAKKVSQ